MSRRATRTFTPKRATDPERTISARDIRDALYGLAPPGARTERNAIRVDVELSSLTKHLTADTHHVTGRIRVDGFDVAIDIPVTVQFIKGLAP